MSQPHFVKTAYDTFKAEVVFDVEACRDTGVLMLVLRPSACLDAAAPTRDVDVPTVHSKEIAGDDAVVRSVGEVTAWTSSRGISSLLCM